MKEKNSKFIPKLCAVLHSFPCKMSPIKAVQMNVVLFNPLRLCQYKLYIDMFFLNKTGISYHLWSGKLYSNLQANQKNPLVSGMGQSC